MLTKMEPKDNVTSYRSDIDGLRAIAVMGVVLFHAGLGLPGGFSGVDMFFVISGYLITRLIVRDLRNGDFSILTFWERRIRRILPALTVVMIAVFATGWYLSLPFHYLVIGQSAAAVMALSSNIQFWRTTDYFAPAAEENPLLHTWSLSVEEQFYMFVPLLLFLVFRIRREQFILPTLIVCSIASFVFSIFHLRYDPSGAFYLLPSRAWELGVGCILAAIPPIRSHFFRNLSGGLGILLIGFTFFYYDPGNSFPGAAALPPVFGAALIILAGSVKGENRRPIFNRMIGSKALVFVGLCSYSFYLWHWPFFAFHRYVFSNPPAALTAIGYIVASFLVSIASLYLVERPFRSHKLKLKRSYTFAFGGSVILLIFIGSIFIYKSGGVRQRVPQLVAELDSANGDEYMKKEKVLRLPDGTELRVIGQNNLNPTALVWGDSHALASLPAIARAFAQIGRCSVAAEMGGTAPVTNWGTFKNPTKQLDFNRAVMNYAKSAKNEGLTDVILIFYWSAYVQDQKTPNGFVRPPNGFADALTDSILELHRAGLKVTVFEETPVFPVHVAKASALHKWRGIPSPSLTVAENQSYRSVYDPIIDQIRTKAPQTKFFDPQALFLGEGSRFDFLNTDGKLLFKDQSHLTQYGSLRLETALISTFSKTDSGQ